MHEIFTNPFFTNKCICSFNTRFNEPSYVLYSKSCAAPDFFLRHYHLTQWECKNSIWGFLGLLFGPKKTPQKIVLKPRVSTKLDLHKSIEHLSFSLLLSCRENPQRGIFQLVGMLSWLRDMTDWRLVTSEPDKEDSNLLGNRFLWASNYDCWRKIKSWNLLQCKVETLSNSDLRVLFSLKQIQNSAGKSTREYWLSGMCSHNRAKMRFFLPFRHRNHKCLQRAQGTATKNLISVHCFSLASSQILLR